MTLKLIDASSSAEVYVCSRAQATACNREVFLRAVRLNQERHAPPFTHTHSHTPPQPNSVEASYSPLPARTGIINSASFELPAMRRLPLLPLLLLLLGDGGPQPRLAGGGGTRGAMFAAAAGPAPRALPWLWSDIPGLSPACDQGLYAICLTSFSRPTCGQRALPPVWPNTPSGC